MIEKSAFRDWYDLEETQAFLEELRIYRERQREIYDSIQEEGGGRFMRNQGKVEGLRLAIKILEQLGINKEEEENEENQGE